MENLSGGDLFTYLEKRKFTISEHRAKVIAHQISTALYYLHSFGVAHRDLKPENILMADPSENADLKIVDFGLSKIIGPNETSLDPFGTLVIKICLIHYLVIRSTRSASLEALWQRGRSVEHWCNYLFTTQSRFAIR
jgi:serine/threonine protein kinase